MAWIADNLDMWREKYDER